MIPRKIFLCAAVLALGACADQMPTGIATRVDRIVMTEGSDLGRRCRSVAPALNPDLGPWEITERCSCVEKHMIDNLDDSIVLWAVQHRDWPNRPMPAWAVRRQDVGALARAGFAACDLKASP